MLDIHLYLYILLGIGMVLFIVNYPLVYIKVFKRALYIIKTASFKIKMKDDPYFKHSSEEEKKNKLKQDQNKYEEQIDNKIYEENAKQADSPKEATWKLILIILTWPFIVFLFIFAEFLRIAYLNTDDLTDLDKLE